MSEQEQINNKFNLKALLSKATRIKAGNLDWHWEMKS